MARDGAEILADDEERDILDFMLNACGLDSMDFYRNERILTRENLEKNYETLLKMIKARSSRNAVYFVFGYLVLITGLSISEKLRSEILVITELELKKKYSPKNFEIDRRICLEDFREKIKIHRPNMILRPVKLEYFGNLDLSETIIGLRDFNKALDSGGIDKIKHIKLDGWDLRRVPEEIFKLEGFESLSLQFNQITDIPENITRLMLLKYCNLSYNKISSFSTSLSHLGSLEFLDLSHNMISSISESIVNMKSIRIFGLDYNYIAKLPKIINNLNSLKSLYIRNNKIKKIPEHFNNANFSIVIS